MPGIVVGVDGSGHSHTALEWAAKEAAVHQAPLTVLTVHQAVAGFYGSPVSYPGDDAQMQRAREAVGAETDKVLAALGEGRPASVEVRAVNGFPAEELVKAADGADMVVLGSRGAGGFSRLLMGSVTFQVAQHAHCPVLIVPPAHS
jgi:nucleotide-binding universal stress UspA family protein